MQHMIEKFLTKEKALSFAQPALGLVFFWFGLMNFVGDGPAILGRWLEGHAFLSGLAADADQLAMLIGFAQCLSGLLLIVPMARAYAWIGAAAIGIYSATAILVLLTNSVWIESLGGFPAIGAGQGIIKYLAIFGLALFITAPQLSARYMLNENRIKERSVYIMIAGLFLVLVWIGGMKFTEVEADGIAPLIATSPFFSWMNLYFDKMEVSYIIGIIEIVAAFMLLTYGRSRLLFMIGGFLCVATFVLTLSFMVSLPGWDNTLGFPYIGGTGHFLLKDLALLAASYVILSHEPSGG